MSETANLSPKKEPSSKKNSAILIALSVADTTWRMFVPSLGFCFLGIWLDGKFDTKPWLMATGIVLGSVLAVCLVKLQLRKLK